MMVIGVTGPTGAGNTTLLSMLEKRGFLVIDCDKLYYELLDSDQSFRQALERAFGPIFLPDGSLDRPRLAARVFGDSRELARLNAVVYPAVYAAVEQKVRDCSQIGVAIDAINLIESGLDALCTRVAAVTAPPEMRLRRIMARDRIDEKRAADRIAAQKPEQFYREHCDSVLENPTGDREAFEKAAEVFLRDLIGG